jgi:hypothetical protein
LLTAVGKNGRQGLWVPAFAGTTLSLEQRNAPSIAMLVPRFHHTKKVQCRGGN